MPVYIVTGKLGGGKSLVATGIMRDGLMENRKVATNMDLWLENLINVDSKRCTAYRLPDKLSLEAIESLGYGSDKFGEKHNGILVLDEGALQFNSRTYRDAGRQDFINWMVHARKKRWDVYIIVQHFDVLDKQIRDMFGEHVVYCTRTDRIKIPYIGFLLTLLTLGGWHTPRMHLATTRYGNSPTDPVTDREVYRGTSIYNGYDTEQSYDFDEESGVFQYLPPYYTVGRFQSARSSFFKAWHQKIANFSLWTSFKRQFFLIAVLIGFGLGQYLDFSDKPEAPQQQASTSSFNYQSVSSSGPLEPLDISHPLDGVRISSTYKHSTGQIDYKFIKHDERFYPNHHGYKVFAIDDSSVALIGSKDKYKVGFTSLDISL